ncbi:ABC transporter permease [Aliivibrio sp. S4TY2]|uniref:ABC transporter permease subunit n=1 Tax=Aliivibrio finisterrensis TaxID=511998 RepID=A0A4Q5KJP3_9GAMM|nr:MULTISPECIES: ABC transporter permease [Aliivibrio]MDD9155646.1 ABC transporter permease [Aliivibrio sp. S4TY2]MDD9160513.1 ABC transporter permease [Aliivibrio sp. S4TY1]MDD9164589.1 ABC transporter permease [Aliivibrio sp. S4MY2]MDD9168395.1 ABC transporter permease [Aliivibrio sp. S4MY4]MDD9173920.1 ABC transporter permease [Aliivibrio sp. S3TY1]
MTILATSHEAIQLLFSGDAALWSIVGVSFSVSLFAMAVVLLPALLLAFALAYGSFPGRWLLLSIINTLQSVPTVVIGLLLYMVLSRSGPLGDWQLLFTQEAMIIGQMFICFPIMVAMMHGAFQHSDRRVWETAFTLGASLPRAFGSLIWETRFPILAAVIAGFSRIITEVGCSMMVGGNIFNATRNIPTAIAMESQKGAFAQGVALGMVLLILALVLNFLLSITRGKGYLRT